MPLSPADQERLNAAIQNGNVALVSSILKSHKGQYQHLDPFYIALSEGEDEAAVLILKDYIKNQKSKLTPEFVNNPFYGRGAAPIHLAGMSNNLELLELLLSIKGINVNAKTQVGETVLLRTAKDNRHKMVERLLAVDGIKIDEVGIDSTPFSIACLGAHFQVAKLLLRKGGIDVNRLELAPPVKGAELLGITHTYPLMMALNESEEPIKVKCDLELVKMIVRAGANLYVNGKFVLDMCVSSNEAETYIKRIQALRAAQGYEQTPELFKAKKELFDRIEANDEANQVEKVKSLIAKYPILLSALDEHSEPPKEGDSPLHRACRLGRPLIIDALLAAGDNVNRIKSSSNGTPVYMAAQEGHTEVVKLLVTKWKTKVDVPNIYKDTALVAAADKNFFEIARILVAAGANINHINGKNKSCLDVATKHPELAKLLKEKGAHTSAELKANQNGAASVQSNGTSANGIATINGGKPIIVPPSAAQPAALPAASPTKPLPATPKTPAVIAASTGFLGSNAANGKSNGYPGIYSTGSMSRGVALPLSIPGAAGHANGSALGYTPPSPPKVT